MTKPVFSVFAKTEMATPQDVTSKDINTTTHIYAGKLLISISYTNIPTTDRRRIYILGSCHFSLCKD
jgi:hypothetical protein